MNLALSEVLDLVRRWQSAGIEAHCTMMADYLAADCNGYVIVEGESFTIQGTNGCDFRFALNASMRFVYRDKMLRISTPEWHCNLYEAKDKDWVRLV